MMTDPGTYDTTVTRGYYLQHQKPKVVTGQVVSERHHKSPRKMHHGMMSGGWQAAAPQPLQAGPWQCSQHQAECNSVTCGGNNSLKLQQAV